MDRRHPLERAADSLGGIATMASLLGVSVQAVSNWKGRPSGIPVERCVEIANLPDVDVKLWDLRPDDWHKYWPMLVGTEGAPTPPAQHATTGG